MWQRAIESTAFLNNYSPFCWCWETQGYSPSAQPLEKCNYVLEMHCLEESLLQNGNYQLKLEIRKRKFLSRTVYWNLQSYQSCCFFTFYPKLAKIKAKKNHYSCPTYFIEMFKMCENINPFIKYYHSVITALSNT